MTGAPLPPEEDITVKEDDDGVTPSAAVTASQPVATSELQDSVEAIEEVDENHTPVLDEFEGAAVSDTVEDAVMTASTSTGETNVVPTTVNTLGDSNFDLNSAVRMQDVLALKESLSVEQTQAIARDDVPECIGVPASLHRRLSG